MRVLVTGGAGYIGSHVLKALGRAGYEALTLDNLSTGREEAVLYGGLAMADLGEKEAVRKVLEGFRPDAVMHFAASIEVEESVRLPLKYYRNNMANTLNILEAMSELGIRLFIFSSSAAVYGVPEKVPIREDSPLLPVNPYGRSKLSIEGMLGDLSRSSDFRHVSLRYFNAAGADPEGRIGERHAPETHLIPIVLRTAKGERESIKIFGTDYPTPDGTCVRDFIHVDDLADAHVLALKYLAEERGIASGSFNAGYGHGHSVREVIETARRVTGIDFKAEDAPRRPGDPAVLVADNSKLRQALGWRPAYDDLEYIIKTAWNWEKSLKS